MAGAELKIDLLVSSAAPPPIVETNPPFLENENPAPAEINVEIERNIFFRITDTPDDPDSGVDETSIFVEIKQGAGPWQTAILGGVFQAGFTGTITDVFANQLSFDVDIDPTAFLADGSVIQVHVQATDLTTLANLLDVTYSFTTAPGETNPPFIENENPARGASGVFSGQALQFRITDAPDQADSGVDIGTLQVQVEDGLGSGYINAIVAGSFVNGFTGTIVDVFANQLSYDISITAPGGNWTQADRVSVIVDVDDLKS